MKNLVVQEGYPRDKMSSLWGLICKNYKQQFPNLVHLAALTVTAPIHTSDCERGFSAQNQVKTALRNRISSERVDDLLIVKIEGEDLKNFDLWQPSSIGGPISKENCSCHLRVNRLMMLILQVILTFDKRSVNS